MTLTLAVLLLGVFAAVVFAAVEAGDDQGARVGTTETTTGTTETTETTDTVERTDTTETTTAPDPAPAAGAPQGGVDVSGPCDEAEHANDPRCSGASQGATGGGVVDDDHGGRGRGRGRGRGGDADGGFDDHGGNSGHGGGWDDSSGHGSSGGDNSGHGGGED